MTRRERQLRDEIIDLALSICREDLKPQSEIDQFKIDSDMERMWSLAKELCQSKVNDRIFIGRRRGRPNHPMTAEIIGAAKTGNESIPEIGRRLGVHRNTVRDIIERSVGLGANTR